MIEITNDQIKRVNLILGGIKSGPQRAYYNTINRALGTVRSRSGKIIRETYHIKQTDIAGNKNMKMKRANMNNLEGEIEFAGTLIPLIKFNVPPTSKKRRAEARAAVLKNERAKPLRSAFITDLGKYGPGVFERYGRRRETSQQLYGPSPAHMMVHENVMTKVEDAAQSMINKRIEHEISRILNGYV